MIKIRKNATVLHRDLRFLLGRLLSRYFKVAYNDGMCRIIRSD